MRCGLLVGIRWSVCMLKSHRSLCESFSRTGSGLCFRQKWRRYIRTDQDFCLGRETRICEPHLWPTVVHWHFRFFLWIENRIRTFDNLPIIKKENLKIHHHHHAVPLARISLTLSRLFYLSFIAFGRSSGIHPVSSHSCSMYVLAGRPAFARPYVGVHRSTSLMSSSLLLQQCPVCLVRLAWIVFVMGGRWPHSWSVVGCFRPDLFNIARNILV